MQLILKKKTKKKNSGNIQLANIFKAYLDD